jgi:hypothetical protein
MTDIDSSTVAQSWVHSHEEDTADQAVYRPENFAFPPSRGRGGFDLNPDGTMVQFGPGATDRTTTRSGQWEVRDDGRLVLYPEGSDTPSRVMKITSLSADKLVLKKGSDPTE